MHRFFVNKSQIQGEEVVFLDDVQHMRVLRLKVGDEIIACDGEALDYRCRIVEMGRDRVVARILDCDRSTPEPPIEIILYQGLPKLDKMDLVVQKCTEVGVSRIVPVAAHRSVVQLSGDKAGKRVERWERIAEASAKQSGRGRIPTIAPVMSWREAMDDMGNVRNTVGETRFLGLIPYELEKTQSLRSVLSSVRKEEVSTVAILIGPEGGFTVGEVESSIALGAKVVTLGPRILRTETAGLVTAACVLYEWEAL